MNNIKRILCSGIMLTLLLSAWAKAKSEQPNILLIMTDDQGWYDAGFNGNKSMITPHLDAMAQRGIIFDRFYSGSAVCSPTRASVITGRNPYRIGIPDANSGHMKKEEITIAEMLKEQGYATGHFGKWHLGTLSRKTLDANRGGKEKFFDHFSIPSEHGYDEFFCTESKVPTYDPLLKPQVFNTEKGESLKYGWTAVKKGEATESYNTYYWNGDEHKAVGDMTGDDTKVIMDKAIPFIKKAAANDRPFFSTLWIHTPHLPVVTAEKYKKMYDGMTNAQKLYYGCITAMDEQIGRLWNELEAMGEADNTLIFFCSDNGPEFNTPGSAGIFRGRKRSLHEGGLRTPAFVLWPHRLKGGKRVDFPAFTSDYMPTLLSILAIDYPDARPIDGTDLMPFLKNPHKVREKAMGFRYKKSISWVTHQYKLISKNNGKTYELYDILNDESEKNNIIKEKAELAQQMKHDLDAWVQSVNKSKRGEDYN